MKQLLTKIRNRKLVVLGLAVMLVCCMSITAYATSYSFSKLEIGGNGSNVTIFQNNFEGANVRCGFSTSTSYSNSGYIGKPYTLKIEKKGWLWTWQTVAEKTCYYGDTVSLAAYNVGDGEYRFVVTTSPHQYDGIYINDFSASSWN